MTYHNEGIPYYHTNIKETDKECVRLMDYLLQTYGVEKIVDVELRDGGDAKATVRYIHWCNPSINMTYELDQFAAGSELKYGFHHILTTTEQVGDEQEIYASVFHIVTNSDGSEQVHVEKHTIELTAENQKKEDEWWEANKVKMEGSDAYIAIRPGTTDEIAYEKEMVLYALQQAEGFLTKS